MMARVLLAWLLLACSAIPAAAADFVALPNQLVRQVSDRGISIEYPAPVASSLHMLDLTTLSGYQDGSTVTCASVENEGPGLVLIQTVARTVSTNPSSLSTPTAGVASEVNALRPMDERPVAALCGAFRRLYYRVDTDSTPFTLRVRF